jgi:hypothetical protein
MLLNLSTHQAKKARTSITEPISFPGNSRNPSKAGRALVSPATGLMQSCFDGDRKPLNPVPAYAGIATVLQYLRPLACQMRCAANDALWADS